MSHELELTLLNTSPPVKRVIKLEDELPVQALQGILQTAFGRESTHLEEWTVLLSLKSVSHQLGFSFSGYPPNDHRQFEARPARMIGRFSGSGDFDDYYDHTDFDDDDELYWRNRTQAFEPDPDIPFKELVKEARKVASDKPWTVLSCDQIFLCERSGEKEPFFVSVIGDGGEEIGVTVARGWEGFRYLLGKQDEAFGETFRMMITFEEREDMSEEDLRFYQRLGSYFRGKRWPKLRIHEGEAEPRLPEQDEAKLIDWLLSRVRSMSSKARKGWEVPVPASAHMIAAVQDWEMEAEVRKVQEWNASNKK